MAHRAAVYTVHVHEKYKPDETRKLGNFDESGRFLGDFLKDVLDPQSFASASEDGDREVACSKRALTGNELTVIFNPGERGLRADIHDDKGQLAFKQTPTDTQIVQCGSLFRLPKTQTTGLWVVHLNNNRGVKGLVAKRLLEVFKTRYSDLQLVFNPAVDSSAYLAGLDHDNLLSATLYKYDEPDDVSHGKNWVRTDTGLQMELRLKPKVGARLIPNLVKKAVKGDQTAFGKLVEFGGIKFDGAKVEVELDNGTVRTFNIAAPEGGHAFSEDISDGGSR